MAQKKQPKRSDLDIHNIGVQVEGPPVRSEADHFFICEGCGQAVDMRDLGQVIHHQQRGHKALLNDG